MTKSYLGPQPTPPGLPLTARNVCESPELIAPVSTIELPDGRSLAVNYWAPVVEVGMSVEVTIRATIRGPAS